MSVPLDDLRPGAAVYSSDGHRLGSLQRMVLKRSDLTLTHIVVDTGFLRSEAGPLRGAIGVDNDRVVPVEAVRAASDQRVDLDVTADEFKDLPEYSQERFEAPHDLTPNRFDISDVAIRAQQVASLIASTGSAWLVERLNKPLDAVDIREGTDVWRNRPHQKLGDITKVLLDPDTGRVSAFVVRRGFIFRRDVILPVRYVSELFDDLVRVDISDEHLSQLREDEE